MQLPAQLEGLRSSGLCGHGQLAEVRAELWDPLGTPCAPTASFLEGKEVLRDWRGCPSPAPGLETYLCLAKHQ